MEKAQTTEDFIEKNVDLVAGLGALSWGISAVTWATMLAAYVAPEVAFPFALLALTRWYRKLRERGSQKS